MRLWIVLLALMQREFLSCNADNEFQDEPLEDTGILYLDERSIRDTTQKNENTDIEARRRSALDKNFMRFGRGGNYIFDEDLDYNDEFPRSERATRKSDNFLRFGRGKSGDFIRFGRDLFRMARNKDKNVIRFGRGMDLKRTRRDAYSYNKEVKRHNGRNIVRFGRNDSFLRFGRTNAHEPDDIAHDFVPNDSNGKEDEPVIQMLQSSKFLSLLSKIAAHLKTAQCNDLGQNH